MKTTTEEDTNNIEWASYKRINVRETISKIFFKYDDLDLINKVCQNLMNKLNDEIKTNNYILHTESGYVFVIDNESLSTLRITCYTLVEDN